MMDLPSPLEILQQIRIQMNMGKSVAASLQAILPVRPDEFSRSLRVWRARIEAGQNHDQVLQSLPDLGQNPRRRHFLNVLERGLKGAPISDALSELENEFIFCIENRFERQLQLLPIKLLLPLTLCILPGVMLLIAGPFFLLLKGGY